MRTPRSVVLGVVTLAGGALCAAGCGNPSDQSTHPSGTKLASANSSSESASSSSSGGNGGAGGMGGAGAGGAPSASSSSASASSSGATSSASSSAAASSGGPASSSSGGAGGGSMSGAASSSSGMMLPQLVNGCEFPTAEDLTAQSAVTVNFGGALGLKYNPPCIKVKTNMNPALSTKVTFVGDFAAHPLMPGFIINNAALPDGNSPLTPPQLSGSTVTYTMTAPGTYGFYSFGNMNDPDYAHGMMGADFVVQ